LHPAASVILSTSGYGIAFDSRLVVSNASGSILASSENGFETSDAQIIDLTIPDNGYYIIEVASAQGQLGDYRLTISTFEAINLIPSIPRIDHLQGLAGLDQFNAGPSVSYDLEISDLVNTPTVSAGDLAMMQVGFVVEDTTGVPKSITVMGLGKSTLLVSRLIHSLKHSIYHIAIFPPVCLLCRSH
jgi:hypothetical protein